MLSTLFHQTNVSLGARIKFFHHWSEWSKSFNNNGEKVTSSHESLYIDSTASSSQVIQQSTASLVTEEPIQSSDQILLDLFSILNSNQYGLSVIDAYGKTKTMNANLRKMLGKAVLHYFIDAKHDMSVKESEIIAKQIVEAFPGEIMVNINFRFV